MAVVSWSRPARSSQKRCRGFQEALDVLRGDLGLGAVHGDQMTFHGGESVPEGASERGCAESKASTCQAWLLNVGFRRTEKIGLGLTRARPGFERGGPWVSVTCDAGR